ncbi:MULTISPECIES: hypothetical protein [unclassified Romboutsia]|uniref:hypothetical protein n=1 Tax=unclassified Romboutsia TaxID=2626894 RepID=UPI0008223B59|nr:MULTISPECIES: hypothetical protein [unclassified Romboutsia]SCH61110.1 Uncharacterised protein [uncultured Clostridium sp.]
MNYELDKVNNLLKKKVINYKEFNELIGSYYICDFEELEDSYYILKVLSPLYELSKSESENYYTSFVQVVK